MTCIEPLTFITLDGVERQFRLTARQQVLIAQHFGSTLLTTSLMVALPRMLFICLADPGEMTEEQFEEILPPDDDLLLGFWAALKEHYGGTQEIKDANAKYRPRRAATSSSNGSTSQPSGEPTSEETSGA